AAAEEDNKPRNKIIPLGVSDLEKSLAFYRDGMGLATEGIIGTEFEDGAVVFFEMNDDLILALWPKKSFAKDAKVAVSPPATEEERAGDAEVQGVARDLDERGPRAVADEPRREPADEPPVAQEERGLVGGFATG